MIVIDIYILFITIVRKSKQTRLNEWEDPDLKERLLQREALRVLRNEKQLIGNSKEKKIESKREDETMKEFKQRIKQETR